VSRLTAVQLRASDELTCRLVYGTPAKVVAGAVGEVALFESGRLVAYLVERPNAARLFVFRTAPRERVSSVPGVHPEVDLLLATRTRGQTARVRNLFLWLTKHDREPESLSQAFWIRVAGVVAGRVRASSRVLPDLLAREAR
jgi:hypothetical protein